MFRTKYPVRFIYALLLNQLGHGGELGLMMDCCFFGGCFRAAGSPITADHDCDGRCNR